MKIFKNFCYGMGMELVVRERNLEIGPNFLGCTIRQVIELSLG